MAERQEDSIFWVEVDRIKPNPYQPRRIFNEAKLAGLADSIRQVYKGLDIGTEKITKKEMKEIPHHLIDVCEPEKVFSVQEFKNKASEAIREILSRNNLPIVVGGTGFYVDALLYDMKFPEVPPNKELRKRLEPQEASELYKQIEAKDPERANSIDPNNKRRLVRALEVIEELGKVPLLTPKTERYNAFIIGIYSPANMLKKRIEKRLNETLMNGLLREVSSLMASGISKERINEFGLEYRIALECIQGKISGSVMKKKMLKELWRYAKKQRTWFKRSKNIEWFELGESEKIEKSVEEFLK